MKTIAALIALAIASGAQACESVTVEVAPVTVQHDYTRPSSDLAVLGTGWTAGMVTTTSKISVNGCSARLAFEDMRLYVAAELGRSSCGFDVVLDHELEHVRIYTDASRWLPARVAELAKSMPLMDAAKKAMAEVRALQAAHDSDDELHRNITSCRGAIRKLVAFAG